VQSGDTTVFADAALPSVAAATAATTAAVVAITTTLLNLTFPLLWMCFELDVCRTARFVEASESGDSIGWFERPHPEGIL
jgi:hypothetical protein